MAHFRFGRFAVLLTMLVAGCAALPSLEGRDETRALTDTTMTRLGRAVADRIAQNPGKSGIHALSVPSDAFAARAILAATAERSLDMQYYIWEGDQTGYLMFEEVWRAAQRGVRVHILLDDANTGGLDATIAALDAHPNIEVRLYNPLVQRHARAMNFVTDFTRVNRRMHNKAFVADNQVAVVGGRNIGNEYSGAGEGLEYTDLDVMIVGAAVKDVSSAFDLYWNSPSAYPAARIIAHAPADGDATLEAKFTAVRADPASQTFIDALKRSELVQELVVGRLPLEWSDARVVRDDPAKTLDQTARTDVLLLSSLVSIAAPPETSFDLASPYFVPGEEGTNALANMARRGVTVRILTNSLAATDVPPVHAGYVKRRCDLLRAGVRLYELKPSRRTTEDKQRTFGASSLHAKTSAFDRRRTFVGSFNFDQRSALLNTEMGVLIESPSLARRLSGAFDDKVPDLAYEVRIAPDGTCPIWIERTAEGEIRYDIEPETSAAQRGWIQFMSILPIEWLL